MKITAINYPKFRSVNYEQTIFIAPGTASMLSGHGSQSSPYRAPKGDLDKIPFIKGLHALDAVHINLEPGLYTTTGLVLPRWACRISGAGATVRLVPADTTRRTYAAIRDLAWCCYLHIDGGMTVDCNWPEFEHLHGDKETDFGKVDALVCKSVQAQVYGLQVINSGCNGKAFGDVGFEGFPLCLSTIQSEGYGMHPNPSYLEMRGCLVEQSHFINKGYATDFFIVPGTEGDRMKPGERSTLTALITDCVAKTPGAHGFGIGGATSKGLPWLTGGVAMLNNTSHGCERHVNIDAGAVEGVLIGNCRSYEDAGGINITPSHGGNKITVDSFQCESSNSESLSVYVANCNQVVVVDCKTAGKVVVPVGSKVESNVTIPINPPKLLVELEETQAKLVGASNRLAALAAEKAELSKRFDELEAVNGKLVGQALAASTKLERVRLFLRSAIAESESLLKML